MKSVFIAILFLSVSILYNSCRCDKEHTYYLHQQTRDFFTGPKEGSYWVFKNLSDSSDRDTFSLVQRTAGHEFSYSEKRCDGDHFEYVKYMLVSSKANDTIAVRLVTNSNNDTYIMEGDYRGLDLVSDLLFEKRSESFKTYFTDTVKHYNSFTVNDKVFNDVLYVKIAHFYPGFQERAHIYYYARHIGLIRFELYDKSAGMMQKYEIVDYKINL